MFAPIQLTLFSFFCSLLSTNLRRSFLTLLGLLPQARSTQECHLQLSDHLPQPQDSVDSTKNVARKRWKLPGNEMVHSLDEAQDDRGVLLAENDRSSDWTGEYSIIPLNLKTGELTLA